MTKPCTSNWVNVVLYCYGILNLNSFRLTGHGYYVKKVLQMKLFPVDPPEHIWSNRTICEQEFAKVIGIEYEISGVYVVCVIQVNLFDTFLFLSFVS